MTDEQRERVSVGHKGLTLSASSRALISKALTGKYVSPETCARLSAALLGKPSHCQSPETRAKISAGLMGHSVSDASRAATRRSNVGRLVSIESRAKMSTSHVGLMVGPLNYRWKGGITPENHRIRDSHEYMVWRTAVFERDNYTCQDCGRHGGYLEAHHVHEFSKYPDERLLVENGKTLCLPCHDKVRIKSTNKVAQEA